MRRLAALIVLVALFGAALGQDACPVAYTAASKPLLTGGLFEASCRLAGSGAACPRNATL
jgi:hypothetical protein